LACLADPSNVRLCVPCASPGGVPWAQTPRCGLLKGLLVGRASCGPMDELEAETLTAVAEAHCGRPAADNHRADNLVKAPTSERRALPVHLPSREDVHELSYTRPAADARCERSARTSPIRPLRGGDSPNLHRTLGRRDDFQGCGPT